MSDKKEATNKGWLSGLMEDAEFRRHYAREGTTEDFLCQVEELMERLNINRSQLADIMGCNPANITKIMRRSNNLKVSTMVDMALALNKRVRIFLEDVCDAAMVPGAPSWKPVIIQGGGGAAASA